MTRGAGRQRRHGLGRARGAKVRPPGEPVHAHLRLAPPLTYRLLTDPPAGWRVCGRRPHPVNTRGSGPLMARATPADYREFIRVSVDLPLNPKLAMIDDPVAGWAYVVSLCYCGQNLTDGSFPMPVVLRLAGVKAAIGKRLVQAGLWHESGHTCEDCPQPLAGMTVVHDYLKHQRSADEVKGLRDARQEAGRKGAASRWSGNGDGNSHGSSDSKSHSKRTAGGMANGSQPDGNPMPEGEGEGKKKTSSSSPSAAADAAPAPPPREDVERLCERLRDRVAGNGMKPPTITAEWRRHARLLLDADHRDLEQALRLIDWCQADTFWAPNVMSLPKFRKQYDQLLAKARQEQNRRRGGGRPAENRTDANIARLLGADAAPLLRAIEGGC